MIYTEPVFYESDTLRALIRSVHINLTIFLCTLRGRMPSHWSCSSHWLCPSSFAGRLNVGHDISRSTFWPHRLDFVLCVATIDVVAQCACLATQHTFIVSAVPRSQDTALTSSLRANGRRNCKCE